MKILLLGGTGAMGVPLADMLSQNGCEVYITSRSDRRSAIENVKFIKGNAKDDLYLKSILRGAKFDAIVDFMHYRPNELQSRLNVLLNSTDHYFFLSSSRVYASSPTPLKEESSRLLDVVRDEEYLQTDEYALSKARCENIIKESGYTNWTIIRPYITYFTDRLQLSVFEKETWLFRALQGRSIVFSKDLASKQTMLTSGKDVANVIGKLILGRKGFSETLHPVNCEPMTWGEILNIYCDVIEDTTGKRPKVIMLEDASSYIKMVGNTYKYRYDRLADRIFDSSKVNEVLGESVSYVPTKEGLEQAIKEFIASGAKFKPVNLKLDVLLNRYSKEASNLRDYPGLKQKVKYLICRFTPYLSYKQKKQGNLWW